jgi:hypothetical protein
VLFGFISVALALDPSLVSGLDEYGADSIFGLDKPLGFLYSSSGTRAASDLRERVTALLVHRHNVNPIFADFMNKTEPDYLLHIARHFKEPVINALDGKKSKPIVEVGLHAQITVAAIKLGEQSLAVRVPEVSRASMTGIERKTQLTAVLLELLKRPYSDCYPKDPRVAGVSLADLDMCASVASSAIQTVVTLPKAVERLRALISTRLTSRMPAEWPEAFKSLDRVAVFLKLIDREVMELAYRAFKGDLLNEDGSINTSKPGNTGNAVILSLLEGIRARLPAALIRPEDLNLDAPAQLEAAMTQLLAAAGAEVNADKKSLMELTHAWMQKTKADTAFGANGLGGIPMPPRNVQSIAFLLTAAWEHNVLRSRGDPNVPKVLMAQMGTGEGKSLMFAMIAIHAVKVLKKRVVLLM